MAGLGAARKLIKELEAVIPKRKMALESEPHIQHFAKKYGLSDEEVKKFMKQDLDLSIKRLKAAQGYMHHEQKYNTVFSDAPYTKAAVDAYKRKERLREIAFTEPQLRGPKLEANKQKQMNDLALEIEERKNDLRLSGPADANRPRIQQQIEEMERRLDLMEQGAENPNRPKQKITYSDNAAGQVRKEEHVKQLRQPVPAALPDATQPLKSAVNPSKEQPVLKGTLEPESTSQRMGKYKNTPEESAERTRLENMYEDAGFTDGVFYKDDNGKLQMGNVDELHERGGGLGDDGGRPLTQTTEDLYIEGKPAPSLKEVREQAALPLDAPKQPIDKYAMDQINKEVGILRNKLRDSPDDFMDATEGIDPALENDALMNQWSDQGYAEGGIVRSDIKHNKRDWWDAFIKGKSTEIIDEVTKGEGSAEQQLINVEDVIALIRNKYMNLQGLKNVTNEAVKKYMRHDFKKKGPLYRKVKAESPAAAETIRKQFAEEAAKAAAQREAIKNAGRTGAAKVGQAAMKVLAPARAATPLGIAAIGTQFATDAMTDYAQGEADRIASEGIVTPETQKQLDENERIKAQREWEAQGLNVPRFAEGGRVQPQYQDRIDNPSKYPYIQNANGSMATHEMADMDNIAFPMIQRQSDGKLKRFEDFQQAYDAAMASGNYKEFDTPEEAHEYAQNYKTPEFQEYYSEIEARYGGGEPSQYPGRQVKRPVEHTTSYGQMSPELQATLEARDYKDFSPPEGLKADAGDRLLAMREGLGALPGVNAELAGILLNSPIAATIDHFTPESEKWNVIPEMMDQAAKSSNDYWMSNPEYMNEDRSVHPKSTDEAVGYYGSWALDPIGWVGLKGGPALKIPQANPKEFMRLSDRIQNAGRKMHDPDLPKGARNKAAKEYDQLLGEMLSAPKPIKERRVNPQAIDESRRQFLKGTAAATGVGAVGGIASLKYMTKGAEAAKTPIKWNNKLLSIDEWVKAGKPKGELKPYQQMDPTLDNALSQEMQEYGNYVRSMHKEIPPANSAVPKNADRSSVDHTRELFREQMRRKEALLDEQAQMQRRSDIAKIKRRAKENVDARFGRVMTPDDPKWNAEYESMRKSELWKEIDDLMSKDIKNYNLRDDELIDMHRAWGTDTETVFKEVMANNPKSKMRLKDVQKALKGGEKYRAPTEMTHDEIIGEMWKISKKNKGAPTAGTDNARLQQLQQELNRR